MLARRRVVNRMTFPKRDVRAMPAYTLDFWTDAARIRKPLETTTPHLTTPRPPLPRPTPCAFTRVWSLGTGSRLDRVLSVSALARATLSATPLGAHPPQPCPANRPARNRSPTATQRTARIMTEALAVRSQSNKKPQ
jgi:hypothetical protein